MSNGSNKSTDKFLILLEEIRSQNQLLAEGQLELKENLTAKIETVRADLKGDIQNVELAVKLNRQAIEGNRKAIEGNRQEIKGNRQAIQELDQRLSKRMDRLEVKVDRFVDKVEDHDKDIRVLKDQVALSG